LTRAEREAVFRRLAEAMHEAIAVERDGIKVANARFAELCGAASPGQLVGRSLAELVHPDFAGLMAEHVRRHARDCRRRTASRLSCARPTAGGRALEFTFSRISYEGQPALLVTAVEMSPLPTAGEAGRGHATAWEALDALVRACSRPTSRAASCYINKSGEMLVGKPAPDVLGKTLPR